MMKSLLPVLFLGLASVDALSISQPQSLDSDYQALFPRQPQSEKKKGGTNNKATGGGGSAACLPSNLINKASTVSGTSGTGAKAGQTPSKTDPENFIKFCAGKTLTNGQQNKQGSCNPVPMGNIPSTSNMVSTVITNLKHGETLPAGKDFEIIIKITGMQLGNFVNPEQNYYSAPQDVNSQGKITGHVHVVCQDVGSLDPTTPPDPTKFAFFKGINSAGTGNGGVSTTVTGGLKTGSYRCCTMTAAANHQPVIMPIAQRGPQDDCRYIAVVGGGGGGGGGGNSAKSSTGGQNAGGRTEKEKKGTNNKNKKNENNSNKRN